MVTTTNKIVRKLSGKWRKVTFASIKLKYRLIGQVRLAPGAVVEPKARIDLSPTTSGDWLVEIGENSRIKSYAQLGTRGGFIRIGRGSSINPFCVILGYGGVTIGDKVRIAAHCSIIAFNHNFEDKDTPVIEQGNRAEGVVIEDDVWIGTGVRILDGVTIGKGSVVGAGSVVNRSLPPNSIAVGIPARVVKKRGGASE